MTEHLDTVTPADLEQACDYARELLDKRRSMLTTGEPRAARLTLALAELIAADRELTEQETAAAPQASPLLEGFAAAWRTNTPNT